MELRRAGGSKLYGNVDASASGLVAGYMSIIIVEAILGDGLINR